MSNYKKDMGNYIFEVGYDRHMDYIFVQVICKKTDKYLYSNLNDKDILFSSQIDFTYFDEKLLSLGFKIPEDLKAITMFDRFTEIKLNENLDNLSNLDRIDYKFLFDLE